MVEVLLFGWREKREEMKNNKLLLLFCRERREGGVSVILVALCVLKCMYTYIYLRPNFNLQECHSYYLCPNSSN
jgi:hypothetical protein